jgi:hypothetical protein
VITFLSHLNWGDVPTWVGVLFAGVAGLIAYRLYQIENKRDRQNAERLDRLEQEGTRRQANQICGWYGVMNELAEHASGADIPGTGWGAIIRNASDLPVYNVMIFFYYKADLAVQESSRRGDLAVSVVPPGESFLPAPQSVLDQADSPDRHVVAMMFRDAAGLIWTRETDGELSLSIPIP